MSVLLHPGEPLRPHDLASAWSYEPAVIAGLGAAAALYAMGLQRIWRRAGDGRGIRAVEAVAFCAGWLALVVALVSPLHALGGALFSAHMAQHELLVVVAAPLLVLGRPLLAMLWALPMVWRRALGAAARRRPVRASWRALTAPAAAWLLHALAIWLWHVPGAYQATLRSDAMHTLQHISFLLTGLLFWWALVHGRGARLSYGAAVVYVFTTALHTSALGVLLTFSSRAWYPAYAGSTAAWGLTPLEDQQLAGLIMWIPASVAYLVAALALTAAWLRESERRVQRWQSGGGVLVRPQP